MFYLILSIVFSGILVLLFKVFQRTNTPIFPAIVVNYWFATINGIIFLPDKQQLADLSIFNEPWVPLSIMLGTMFITVFNLISITTVRFGVSTASVASKLGLVFPVLMAFLFYNESFNWLKLTGIILAFAGVILSSIKPKEQHATDGGLIYAFLPIIVFFSSGACDVITQYVNKKYLYETGMAEFALFIFMAAGTVGSTVLVYQLVTGKAAFSYKSLLGGAVLGTANYFSFLFLLKALAHVSWGSSVIFPLNNLGVVAFATVAGIILFKEKISAVNMAGLAFAAASIIVIVLSN